MGILQRAYTKLIHHELAPAILAKLRAISGNLDSQFEYYKNDFIYHRQIAKIYAAHKVKNSPVHRELIRQHVQLWKPLAPRIDTKWIQVYMHISGVESANYIPEDIYYQIVEPCLNYQPLLKGFSDKNLYDRSDLQAFVPKTVIRKMNGVWYDRGYTPLLGKLDLNAMLEGYPAVIVKPTINTSGGKRVALFQRRGTAWVNQAGEALTVPYLDRAFGENYIIQEKIIEHESLSQFNSSSVNTIRLYTYRSVVDEKVIAVDALLRVGKSNSITDNMTSGGLAVGLDQNGVLNNFAIDLKANRSDCLGDIDLKIPHRVENFQDIVEVAKKVARTQFYSRLLGFDMTVDADARVRILEINNRHMGINPHQMLNGPLFKEYTQEIIAFCMKNRQARERK